MTVSPDSWDGGISNGCVDCSKWHNENEHYSAQPVVLVSNDGLGQTGKELEVIVLRWSSISTPICGAETCISRGHDTRDGSSDCTPCCRGQ